MQKSYDHRNCSSLFGYAAKVHVRNQYQCQLCGCGGLPVNFDLWRQLTVEHIIGESQGGYVKDLRTAVATRFPEMLPADQEALVLLLDEANTVTACSFCNSTTSRDRHECGMAELLAQPGGLGEVLGKVNAVLAQVLARKREKVLWKLQAVRAAFDNQIAC